MNTAQDNLRSMFIGTIVSFVLNGIIVGQTIWYFRSQSDRSSKSMNALIWFIWSAETLNCVFIFFSTRETFLNPAAAQCRYWSAPAQGITSAMCTFAVESFFIIRMWRLSERKKIAALTFIPYLMGHGFAIAQIIRSFQVLCKPDVSDLDQIFVFGTYGCRLVGDGIVVVTMCYILHSRSSGFTRHANTIRIVRRLILWTISTGMLTWLNTALFLASYAGALPSGYGLFYVRGGLYTNAMLAQLNARIRFRAIAEESIPLSSIHLNLSTTQQDHPQSS